jgi:hypothetical protein
VRRPASRPLAVVAGLMVGALAAVVVVGVGGIGDRAAPAPAPEATGDFIAAFQRSIEGTYVVEADYRRVLDDGRTMDSATFVAQRPPDRIERQFGGITGTVNGKQVNCSTATEGQFKCGVSAAAPDPVQVRQQQMDNLQSYFAAPALYRVVRSGADCFELTQMRAYPTAPYGSRARICFDEATGAIRFLEEHLDGAVDTLDAVTIRGQVSDQDFDLSQNTAYDQRAVGEPDATTTTVGPGDLGGSGSPATSVVNG